VIRRATDENVSERFVDFTAMAGAVVSKQMPRDLKRNRRHSVVITLAFGLIVCAIGWWFVERTRSGQLPEQAAPNIAAVSTVSAPTVTKPAAPSPGTAITQNQADGYLAYGALTAAQGTIYNPDNPNDPVDEDFMTSDENNLYQDMLIKIQNSVQGESIPDFQTAIQLLDACMNSLPRVNKSPNIQLARLLLQQCADERAAAPAAVNDPSFLVLGNDDLDYRVALLCGLGAAEKADELLGGVIAKESGSTRQKSKVFFERARVRAGLGKFAAARTDAEQSVALADGNPALKALREMDITQLQKDIPAYADFLKSLPEK